jgi:two-component system KDP operon response regulator KdpE
MNSGLRILLIDDEHSICKFLRASLENEGAKIFEAHTGHEALQGLVSDKPDLVILDLGLPDIPGLEILRRFREWSKTPVIVLTAQDSDDDKVSALDSGADDYLTKPFSVKELHARIRAALRHSIPDPSAPVFRSGPLEIDWASREVKFHSRLIRLTVTEYDILRVLARNVGKVVTHRMLLNQVWGPNATEHTQYLRVYVGQIRKKLQGADLSTNIISTESGVGYRLLLIDSASDH